MPDALELDAVIFGGGGAGLWLLDELIRAGYAALLFESNALGSGQTVASQGIIHGGVKYTLTGVLTASARVIAGMPGIWRACLAGERTPDLRNTIVRCGYCHLWRTEALTSRVGLRAAQAALRTKPVELPRDAWPAVLQQVPGVVLRVDEQVIDTASFVADLARQHTDRLLKYDPQTTTFDIGAPGELRRIRVRAPDEPQSQELELWPRRVLLAAGEGNAELRARCGLDPERMQRRPLHMVLVRGGTLPELHGHCVDGAKTRVTITSARDSAGRMVWQVGGNVAEQDVGGRMAPGELIAFARRELQESIPGLDMAGTEWATYRVDRAEPRTRTGLRPEDAWCKREGNVITAWPTKLALAPRLAELVLRELGAPNGQRAHNMDALTTSGFAHWPRPAVARLPWEAEAAWTA